jgi:hypothetical protein
VQQVQHQQRRADRERVGAEQVPDAADELLPGVDVPRSPGACAPNAKDTPRRISATSTTTKTG